MAPRNLTVLVVSENRSLLRDLSRFLAALRYEVAALADRALAAEALGAEQPDFLILDSEPSAAEAIQWLREIRAERLQPLGTLLLVEDPSPEQLTDALEAGVDDFLCKPIHYVELPIRLRAAARVLEFERRWQSQEGRDPLTGLADRSFLLQRLDEARRAGGGGLLLVHLDPLEAAIRRRGRAAGEAAILAAAATLQKALDHDPASSHGEPPPTLAHFGGGRFAVALPGADESCAAATAERLRRALSEGAGAADSDRLPAGASLGAAAMAAGDPSIDEVLRRAEQALHDARASGGDCVASFGQFDEDRQAWSELVADGRLFDRVVARDVMTPCTLLLRDDQGAGRAARLLKQTGLGAMPVVDPDGCLVGLVVERALRTAEAAGDSALRVKDLMIADPAALDEEADFATLRRALEADARSVVVIVSERRPTGLVLPENLAALAVPLTSESFAPAEPWSGSAAYLIVPDLKPPAASA
jgi:two-component system, cell cycle response regulator